MGFKYVFFDFDGTLADTESLNLKIYHQLADIYNIKKLTYEEFLKLKKLSMIEVIEHLDIKKRRIPFMLRKGKIFLYENISKVEFCKSDLKETIIALKDSGIRVGIITSNSKKNVNAFLDKHNFREFEFVTNCSLFGKSRVIKKTMKKFGAKPHEVLYVGDEIRDITSSKEAGVSIASVTWGYNSAEGLSANNPEYLISKSTELLEICKNTN